MNIYLDVHGVLIDQWSKAPAYADEFLELVTRHWPDSTYWLSTYTRDGQDNATHVLQSVLSKRTMPLLKTIKTVRWGDIKTDGIDFKQPFLWFDDHLSPEEKEILEHYDALACHRHINLIRDPMQLLDEIVYLKSLAR